MPEKNKEPSSASTEPKFSSNKKEHKKYSNSRVVEKERVDTPFKPSLKRKEPPSDSPVVTNFVNSKKRKSLYFLPMVCLNFHYFVDTCLTS